MAEADYADFLARTGANESGKSADYAAFLARTGAKEVVPTPNPNAGLNEYGLTGEPGEFTKPDVDVQPAINWLSGTDRPRVDTGDTIHPDIRNALAPAPNTTYGQVLPFARDQATGALRLALPSSLRDLANGGLDLLEGPTTGTVTPAATNALAAAAMGGKLTPTIAGDSAAALAAGAEGRANGAPLDNLYERFQDRNALDPNAPRGPALEAPQPALAAGAPVPQSVGAAASRDLSNPAAIMMTPKEVAAYAATAEGQKLIEPQPVGVPDTRQLVPGVTASTAEIEQTVNAARDAKTANIEHPEVSQAAKEIAAENNDARQRYLASIVKSPVDVNNAIEARAAQAERDLAEVWKNKTEADAQPVIDAANAIKVSPDGRRPVVRNAVDAVTNELYDADGKLITDPEQLYGVRKHIDDLLSKEAGATDPKSIRAAANLQQLKTALDGVIEPAAPGFNQYLKNFADASKPIDEMQVLQGHQNKLYDTQGRMQLSRVQTMMRNIVDSRLAPGINPYKSISDDTMQQLWDLRDNLRRSASAQELARTPGSDTSQTMFDLAKKGAAIGGDLVMHGIAHKIAPIVGPIVLNAVKAGVANKRAAGAKASGVKRGIENLNPNRLVPPED